MTETFDKFAWLKALQADTTVTDKVFRLGVVIATHYTRRNGTGWVVNLDEVASHVKGGLTVARFNDGTRHLATRGFLVEVKRSLGGRPRKGETPERRGAFDLVVPTETDARNSVGLHGNPRSERAKPTLVTRETHARNGENPRSDERGLTPIPADQTPQKASTGTSSGTSEGTSVCVARTTDTPNLPAVIDSTPTTAIAESEVITVDAELVGDDHDPEPSRFCSRHPDDTEDSCPGCMRTRKRHERWAQRHPDAHLHELLASMADSEVTTSVHLGPCSDCGGGGFIEVDDDTVRKCLCRGGAR